MPANISLTNRLTQIHAQMMSGETAGALSEIQQVVSIHPDSSAAWQLQAIIQRAIGDFAGSSVSFEKALDTGVASAELLNSYGILQVQRSEYELAEALFRRAIAADNKYIAAKISLGRLFSRLSLYDEAIAVLEMAVELDPKSTLALITLGTAYRLSGNSALAVTVVARAIDNGAVKPEDRLHLGIALHANDQPKLAIALYNSIESAGFSSPELLDNRAASLLQCGEIDAALLEYKRAALEFPGYFAGHNAYARLVIEYGLDSDPFQSYKSISAQYPAEPSVWQNWLSSLVSYRRYDDVILIAHQAEYAIGSSPFIDYARAVAFTETGAVSDAAVAFEAASNSYINNADFQIARSRLALKSGDYLRASAFADAAISLSPFGQLAWAYKGLSWRLLNDAREFWLHDYDRFAVQQIVTNAAGAAIDLGPLAKLLRRLHTAKRHPPNQSLRGGTQTEGTLLNHKDPVIAELRGGLLRALQHYVDILPEAQDHPFLSRKSQDLRFSGSWSVRLMEQGFHIHHVHEEGWVSSAMHIVIPHEQDGDTGDAGSLVLGAPPIELGLNLPPRRVVKPVAGALVLFPSSMWHGTVPHQLGGERLSVAFDAVPRR